MRRADAGRAAGMGAPNGELCLGAPSSKLGVGAPSELGVGAMASRSAGPAACHAAAPGWGGDSGGSGGGGAGDGRSGNPTCRLITVTVTRGAAALSTFMMPISDHRWE